jgi:hypothetical protein
MQEEVNMNGPHYSKTTKRQLQLAYQSQSPALANVLHDGVTSPVEASRRTLRAACELVVLLVGEELRATEPERVS